MFWKLKFKHTVNGTDVDRSANEFIVRWPLFVYKRMLPYSLFEQVEKDTTLRSGDL